MKALLRNPKCAYLIGIYADYLFETSRFEEAQQFYEYGLAVDPKHPHLLNNYAVFSCLHLQNYEKAVGILRTANSLVQEGRLILHNLIHVLTLSGSGEVTELTALEKEMSLRKSQVQSPKT